MTEKEKTITPQEAERILAAERDRNLRACRAEIEQALEKYGYELAGVPSYTTDGRMVVTVQLRPIP